MTHTLATILALALTLSTSGCATLLKGSGTSVAFDSTPPGAEVVIGGKVRATTPCALHIRSSHDVEVELRKVGYESARYWLTRTLEAGWVVADALLMAPLSLAVDASTGDWSAFEPDYIRATLHPVAATPDSSHAR